MPTGPCGERTNAASVSRFERAAEAAHERGAQIVVFPEYGITGFCGGALWKGAVAVPDVGSLPCEDRGAASTVQKLSCVARRLNIVMVVDLAEAVSEEIFNTALAFAEDGRIAAKYRKQNLWHEAAVATPEVNRPTSFVTSFGVVFGLFVCADLIYEHPALDLVRAGVKNFVVPVAWSDEMQHLQVLPYAQGWSALHGVSVVLANGRMPGMSGSAVIVRGRAAAYEHHPRNRPEGDFVLRVASVADERVRFAPFVAATPLPSFTWSSQCGPVSCRLRVAGGSPGDFVLIARSRWDRDARHAWPATLCAAFRRKGAWPVAATLSMTGHAADIVLVPGVLAAGGRLLQPGDGRSGTFALSGGGAVLTAAAPEGLEMLKLYGRPFRRDRLPYAAAPDTSRDGHFL